MKEILLERRFFANDDEWEYMLFQLGADQYKNEKKVTVTLDVYKVEEKWTNSIASDFYTRRMIGE